MKNKGVSVSSKFFNILDANGLIGVTAAVFLIVCVLSLLIKNYFKVEGRYQLIIVIGVTSAMGLAAASMFGEAIFYSFSPNMITSGFCSEAQ